MARWRASHDDSIERSVDAPDERSLVAPGGMVDHFRIMRLIGRGGNGEVYLARDLKLGRKVALKIVRPDMLGTKEAIARFLFEARATAKVSHLHIVTVFAVGEHQAQPYVALEYLAASARARRKR